MKKNKWLLMLAAIVLMATCLFAGLAVADDAGTGTADDVTKNLQLVTYPVDWKTGDVYTNSATFDVDLKFVGANRKTSNAPFVAPVGTDMGADNYYSGKIKVAYGDPEAASKRTDGNIDTVYIALYQDGKAMTAADAQAYMNENKLYFNFTTGNATIIYPERATDVAKWGRLISIDELIAANEMTLNFMSKHELLPVLYNPGPVLTGAGMFPGSTSVKVQLCTIKEETKTLENGQVFTYYKPATAKGVPATLKINVNVMKWTDVNYTPGYVVGGKDGDTYVIYLDTLQTWASYVHATDIGWEFSFEWGLGSFSIVPDYATYQRCHFEIEGTDVANIRSDFSEMVIKKTGTFTLIVTDESKTSDVEKRIKFVVKGEQASQQPVLSANFTYDRFDRTVGEYLDLNKYAYLTRKVVGAAFNGMPVGTIYKQHLYHNTNYAKSASEKYAREFATTWVEDDYAWCYVNEPAERFHIRWKSSNTDVARVVNAEDIFYDLTTPWTVWLPESYWDWQHLGTTSAPIGARLTWYSKIDRKIIYPSQGYVAFVGAGKATITVEVVNYGDDKTVYSASTTVYVKNRGDADVEPEDEEILVTKISAKKVTLKVGEKKELAFTVKPANATNQKVTFSSSDKKIVKINSKGVMTARKAGTAYITITAKDGSGVSKTIKVTVK
jgi:hypothetical protein